MADWLQFHIFTGLVGPYLVLLHTSWKFNGLAGVVTWMTVVIVASGFVGRYIYTAIPRTADGVEVAAGVLQQQIQATEVALQSLLAEQPQTAGLPQRSLAGALGSQGGLNYREPWPAGGGIATRLTWWVKIRRLDAPARAQARSLAQLLRRRRALHNQLASLARARQLLALWHTVHIPLGMALFTAAFIHIIAAIYYATLLR